MISFENKKILITNADTLIGRELSIKLSSLGAELILTGEDITCLKEISSQINNESNICISSLEELTSKAFDKNNFDLDGYLHCNFLTERDDKNKDFNKYSIEYYLKILEYIEKNNYSKNISILLLQNHINQDVEDTIEYYHQNFMANNLPKVLSCRCLTSKMRINTLISDTNENEKVSNMAIYLLSNSSRFIVGEEYNISNN